RTDGQGNLLPDQALDEPGVLLTAHTVIDAPHGEQVERLTDIARRAFLAGMRDSEQSLRARTVEHRCELRRGMAGFRGIETYRRDELTIFEHLIEGAIGFSGAQVTQEARDEAMGHAEAALRLGERQLQALDDGAEGNAARGVCLRIEKDVGMDDTLLMSALQVTQGQAIEVVLVPQHI